MIRFHQSMPRQHAPKPKEPVKKTTLRHLVSRPPCRSPVQLVEIERRREIIKQYWGQAVSIRYIANLCGYNDPRSVYRTAERLKLPARQWGIKGDAE